MPSASPAAIGLMAYLTALPTSCWSHQPLITDDTGTQGAGDNQIETAFTHARARTAGSETITRQVPVVYTRGLTQTLDVFLGTAVQRISPPASDPVARGWGNTVVGAKWRFHDDDARKLSFALNPTVQFPISRQRETRGLGSARTSYALGLLMTQETGFGFLHANIAAAKVNFADPALAASERAMRYRISVAPVWDVNKEWALALDAGLLTNPARSSKPRMGYVEAAAIYSPDAKLDLAVGLIRNLMDGDVAALQGTATLTWRF